MIRGLFNVVLDGQWGSSGKGKLCAFLADKYNVTDASSSNMPNAGHTVQFRDSTKFIFKCLPSALALNPGWEGVRPAIRGWLSPGSSFYLDRLLYEIAMVDSPIYLHGRAQVMEERHKAAEQTSTKHVASTMQGCGEALAEKILRKKEVKLAGSMSHFSDALEVLTPERFRSEVYDRLSNTRQSMWLHEVSQGYALSIDHGTHYPNCTSRNCTTQAALDQMSVPPQWTGDVYLNLRPYPIRVGNVVEDGKEVGYSGDFEPWGKEINWASVAHKAGMPESEAKALLEKELTTVTKRLRRVGTFSFDWLQECVRYNGVTKIALNFMNYIDYACSGMTDFKKLTKRVRAFVDKVEEKSGKPVVFIGTGPNHEDMCVNEILA